MYLKAKSEDKKKKVCFINENNISKLEYVATKRANVVD